MKRVAATVLLAIGLLHGPARAVDSGNPAQAASDQARAAAARELKAQPGEFTVVSIQPAQWSDSNLGCGKAGARSAQVMTNGYTVVLERQGQRNQVNVAGSHAVLCETSTRMSGTVRPPTSTRGLDRITLLARQDLAHRLRLDAENIRVANVEPRRWTDDDMNCSGGGAGGESSAVGYRIELSASGRSYFYHTDLRSVRACPPI
jgi:hypothetical protein